MNSGASTPTFTHVSSERPKYVPSGRSPLPRGSPFGSGAREAWGFVSVKAAPSHVGLNKHGRSVGRSAGQTHWSRNKPNVDAVELILRAATADSKLRARNRAACPVTYAPAVPAVLIVPPRDLKNMRAMPARDAARRPQ